MTMNGAVLIVENEPLVREAMEDILTAGGLNAIGTGSGQEGIAAYMARQQEIALVILDMRLPGMDGPAILKALRRINPSLKAIISSAYDEQEIKRGFNGEPVSSILRKPFDAEELLSTVRTALDY
jgi:DNA-binding NtrC family response regulator